MKVVFALLLVLLQLMSTAQPATAEMCPNPHANIYVIDVQIEDDGAVEWFGHKIGRAALDEYLVAAAKMKPLPVLHVTWTNAELQIVNEVLTLIRQGGFVVVTNCHYSIPF